MGEDGRTTIDPAVMERSARKWASTTRCRALRQYIANVPPETSDLVSHAEPVTKLIGVRNWPSLKLVSPP